MAVGSRHRIVAGLVQSLWSKLREESAPLSTLHLAHRYRALRGMQDQNSSWSLYVSAASMVHPSIHLLRRSRSKIPAGKSVDLVTDEGGPLLHQDSRREQGQAAERSGTELCYFSCLIYKFQVLKRNLFELFTDVPFQVHTYTDNKQ